MERLIQNTHVKPSEVHGWGVFANSDIKKGKVIEESIFLKTPKDYSKNYKSIQRYIYDYYGCCIIALGNGSVINHSDSPNCEYYTNDEEDRLIYIAIEDIKKGQEIFISYSKDYTKQMT